MIGWWVAGALWVCGVPIMVGTCRELHRRRPIPLWLYRLAVVFWPVFAASILLGSAWDLTLGARRWFGRGTYR